MLSDASEAGNDSQIEWGRRRAGHRLVAERDYIEVVRGERAERRIEDVVVPTRVEGAADVEVRSEILCISGVNAEMSFPAFSRRRAPIGNAPVVDPRPFVFKSKKAPDPACHRAPS